MPPPRLCASRAPASPRLSRPRPLTPDAYLSSWGRQHTHGAVAEECYVSHARFAAQFQGSRHSPPYGFAAVKFDVDLDGNTFYACPARR